MGPRTKNGLPKHCSWNVDRARQAARPLSQAQLLHLPDRHPLGSRFHGDNMPQRSMAWPHKAKISEPNAPLPGTVNALIAAYLDPASSTPPFKTGAAETQRRAGTSLRISAKRTATSRCSGSRRTVKRVMLLTRQHMQQIVNAKASTPSAQRNFLFTIRAMFQWAFKEGRVPDDPTIGITREKIRTTGYPTWTEAEIERFETVHPIGSKARLAFALLLYTGQRRGDVVRMGPQDIHTRHPGHRSAQDRRRRCSSP